jgi:hypothetical protein
LPSLTSPPGRPYFYVIYSQYREFGLYCMYSVVYGELVLRRRGRMLRASCFCWGPSGFMSWWAYFFDFYYIGYAMIFPTCEFTFRNRQNESPRRNPGAYFFMVIYITILQENLCIDLGKIPRPAKS